MNGLSIRRLGCLSKKTLGAKIRGAKKICALLSLCLLASCGDRQLYLVSITSAVVSGELLLNHSSYGGSDSELEQGAVSLVADTAGGEEASLGVLGDDGYRVALLSDNYRPVYHYRQASTTPSPSPEPPLQQSAFALATDDVVIVTPPDRVSGLPKNPEALLPTAVATADRSTWDVNVPAVALQMRVQLDGESFPSSATEYGEIYLRPKGSQALISLGNTNTALRPVDVIPGIYDVVYQFGMGLVVPRNSQHVLETIDLRDATVGSIRVEQLNVQTTTIRAIFSLNGEDFPNSAYDYGLLSLRNGLDEVPLGRSYERVGGARVILGDYDAHYSAREVGDLTPANPDAIVVRDIVIDDKTQVLDINVAAVSIYGNFLLDGNAAPASAYEYGRVSLRDVDTGASLPLGDTYSQTFGAVRVVPGKYQFAYEFREGGALMPVNDYLILPEVLTVRETPPGNGIALGERLDCDIPVVTIAVALTLNGEDFPNSAYDYADIELRRVGSTEDLPLGETFDANLSINVVPGAYDFFYRMRESNGRVPVNTHHRFLANFPIDHSVTLEHDFLTRSIQLLPTLNGEAFPNSAYAYADIAIGGYADERIPTNETFAIGHIVNVIAGEYSVYYSAKETGDGSQIPVNRNAKVAAITVE